MYDHLPNPWGSLPEVVISELNGKRVIIAVPPGLYMSLKSISVSEVVKLECRECIFLVDLNDAAPLGFFQFVFVSTNRLCRLRIVQ